MSNDLPRVLIVEDDGAIRTLLVAALRREPFEVHSASDGAEALQLTQSCEYAVIVLDLMMPRLNGFQFLDAFHGACPHARSVIFVISAFDDPTIGKLTPHRVHAIIKKPFDVPQLVSMISEVAQLWQADTTPPAAALAPEVDAADPSPGEKPN